MTNDNQDALRCAELLEKRKILNVGKGDVCEESAAHLRRLVRENEFLSGALSNRNIELVHAAQQLNAKDTLMRQAVGALLTYQGFIDDAHILEGQWHWLDDAKSADAAIRQHLEGRA